MSSSSTELITKWEQITTDAIEVCEYKVDKLDIALALDALDFTADSPFKTITLSGSEFDIRWFKKKYFEAFKTSFHQEFPGYKFKFIEEKK
jgi:hypothetical protein